MRQLPGAAPTPALAPFTQETPLVWFAGKTTFTLLVTEHLAHAFAL
jgi:hypothetical protein